MKEDPMVAKSKSSPAQAAARPPGGSATPTFLSDHISKVMDGLKLPGIDGHALFESQRKNIDALLQATQIATEGAGAVARRQAEIVQEAIHHAEQVIRDIKGSGQPADVIAAQTDVVRKAFEAALANAHELAEMIERSNTDAFAVIKQRMSESLDEIRKTALRTG
jgi:phasin family protein